MFLFHSTVLHFPLLDSKSLIHFIPFHSIVFLLLNLPYFILFYSTTLYSTQLSSTLPNSTPLQYTPIFTIQLYFTSFYLTSLFFFLHSNILHFTPFQSDYFAPFFLTSLFLLHSNILHFTPFHYDYFTPLLLSPQLYVSLRHYSTLFYSTPLTLRHNFTQQYPIIPL